jgi:hypothetical protein
MSYCMTTLLPRTQTRRMGAEKPVSYESSTWQFTASSTC